MIGNIAWSTISFFLRLLSNVLIFFLIAKEYGPEKFGSFSSLVIYGTVLTLLSDLGTHQRLYKEISINGKNEKQIYKFKFVFMVVTITITIVISSISLSYNMLFVVLSYIINSYIDFVQVRLRAKGEFKKEAYSALVNNFIFFIVTGCVLLSSNNMFLLALSFFCSRLCSILIMNTILGLDDLSRWRDSLIKVQKEIETKCDTNEERQYYYSFDFLLTNIWAVIDGMVVKYFFGLFMFGIYSSYGRVIYGISSLSMIFTNVIFRSIALEAVKRENKKLLLGTIILAISGLFIFIILLYGKDYIVRYLIGVAFIKYADYIPYMFIPVWLKWISSCLGIYLLGSGGVKKRVFAQNIALILFSITFAIGYSLGYVFSAVIFSLSIAYIVIMLFYFKHFMDYKNDV